MEEARDTYSQDAKGPCRNSILILRQPSLAPETHSRNHPKLSAKLVLKALDYSGPKLEQAS